MQQDLINLALWKHKDFRVFYGLLATDDVVSPINAKKKSENEKQASNELTISETDNQEKLTAENNPYNEKHKKESEEKTQNESLKQVENSNSGNKPKKNSDLNVKEWFASLSLEQRVNALTTTSPYLSEVLINMQRLINKKGPIMFALTQNLNQTRTYQISETLNQHYSQGYGPQYFLASNQLYQSQLQKYGQFVNPEVYGYPEDTEETVYKDIPQIFEDCFYCRTQQKTEIEKQKEEPEKLQAFKKLTDNVSFCDLFQYLDTITVFPELVKDSASFFEIMNNSTNGQAFSNQCQFEHDKKLGIHVIESPNWFKPERFQSFASWIAVIFEENLWANYNFYVLKNQGQKNIQIEYLFDLNEMQDGWDSLPLIKTHTLAECWLNSSPEQKQSLINNLESICKQISTQSLYKDYTIRNDFFLYDRVSLTVNNSDLQKIIETAKKLTKNKKQSKITEAIEFIVCLYQSGKDRIEKPVDIVCRTFLKLIQQMYQEQVIDELLVGNTPTGDKPQGSQKQKRKRKKNKEELNQKFQLNPLNQNSDLINQADIREEQNKSEQENKLQIENQSRKQNMTDAEHSPSNLNQLVTSDASGGGVGSDNQIDETFNELPDVKSDHENPPTILTEQINESGSFDQQNARSSNNNNKNKKISGKQKQLKQEQSHETEMKKISCEYVSDMLDKIETEQRTLPENVTEEEMITPKQPKSGKKRKRKEPENKEQVEEGKEREVNDDMIEIQNTKQISPAISKKPPLPQPVDTKPVQTEISEEQSPAKLSKKQKKELKQEGQSQIERKQKQIQEFNEPDIKLNIQKNMSYPVKQNQPLIKQTSMSHKVSRQGSSEPSDPNPENQTTGGRKRQRRKQKNPEDIMNQFIKQKFDTKKDDNYGKFGSRTGKTSMRNSKNNSRIMSRKTSPSKQQTQVGSKTQSYVANENKGQTIIFNEPAQMYTKKTQSAVMNPQKQKKKVQDQKKDVIKSGLPPNPKQNVYQEKSASSFLQEQNQFSQGQPPKPKKMQQTSPNKTQNEAFLNDFREFEKEFTEEETQGETKQQVSEYSEEGQEKLVNVENAQSPLVTSDENHLGVTKQISSKSEVIISSVEEPGTKSNQKEGTQSTQNPHLLQTATAISQINANSPSFKPTKHHSAVYKKESEESKGNYTFESQSMNAIQFGKQNSLQHMAQNLKKVKSFNPNSVSGFSNFGQGQKMDSQNQYTNQQYNETVGNMQNMNKAYQNQYDQQYYQYDNNKTRKMKRKNEHGETYLQDYEVDNNFNQQNPNMNIQSNENFQSGQQFGQQWAQNQDMTQMNSQSNNKPQEINLTEQIGNIGQGLNKNFKSQQIYLPKQVYTTTTTTQGTMPNVNYQTPQGLQELINNATGVTNQSNQNQEGQANTEDKDSQNRFSQNGHQQPNQFMMPQGFGQVSGNIGQINQVNSYNINQFGNLNLGQVPNNHFGAGIQNMQNQFQSIPNLGLMGMPQMQYQNFNMPQMNNQQNMGPQNLGQNNPFVNMNQMNSQPNMMMRNQRQYYDYNINQNIEFKFYEKFDNDIYDEVDKIRRSLDLTKEEREYIKNKLQTMCEDVFKQTNVSKIHALSPQKSKSMVHQSQKLLNQIPLIKQYGSLVTGLALESSDMDMAVTNLNLPDREQMVASLDLFAEHLQKWNMIEDLNAISTASVPVIKATVDLNKLRATEFKAQDKQQDDSKDFGSSQNNIRSTDKRKNSDQYGAELSKTKLPDSLSKLKIDITFDDSTDAAEENDFEFMHGSTSYGFNSFEQNTHKGLASCRLIKHYVEDYKCLKQVSIILKLFLAKMDLNSPYHGGLSSYSTVLLLVAYMNKWNLKMSATLTPARLLMGFLDYYSYYFNVSLFGIDVSNDGSFYELSSPESNFVILDPLNEQNNTTKNSFLTHEIIKSFRKAFTTLKNLLLQYQQMQNSNITDNLVDVILRDSEKPNEESASTAEAGTIIASQSEDQTQTTNGQQQPIQIQIQQIQQIQILQQLQQ